tara:strand:- start:707 stop:1120 length:414 start_codon:yes stop_codon:yes gene_type:complete
MGRVFFNTRKNIDAEACSGTTTYVMLASDSGKTFMVKGGTQAITLLPAADVPKGWHANFVCSEEPSGDKTFGAGSTMIHGVSNDAGNGIAAGSDGTAKSNILIKNEAKEGDTFSIFSDGTLYYYDASGMVNDSITVS